MIKYRVWNSNIRRYENWHCFNQEGKSMDNINGLYVDRPTYKKYFDFDDCISKMIYENDIIIDNENKILGCVKYNTNKLQWSIYDGYKYNPLYKYNLKNIKIIGSIREKEHSLLEDKYVLRNYLKTLIYECENIYIEGKTSLKLLPKWDEVIKKLETDFFEHDIRNELKHCITVEDVVNVCIELCNNYYKEKYGDGLI